jgi:DNA-binding NarL/FixJ family response regulator
VRRLRVLMAVQPAALARVIGHLLDAAPEMRVVGSVMDRQALLRRAGRSAPDVIVANARVLGREIGAAVAAVKGSSPGSKLIVISAFEDLSHEARLNGADLTLEEESLVRALPRALRTVASRSRAGIPKRRSPL